MSHKRLFFALKPTKEICIKLDQYLDESYQKHHIDDLHLTLHFLGSVADEVIQLLCDKVKDIKQVPFTGQLNEMDCWTQPKIACVLAEKTSELVSLHDAMSLCLQSLALPIETRVYRPHVTLARKVTTRPAVLTTELQWQVDSFCLYESLQTELRPRYKILHEWPLQS